MIGPESGCFSGDGLDVIVQRGEVLAASVQGWHLVRASQKKHPESPNKFVIFTQRAR